MDGRPLLTEQDLDYRGHNLQVSLVKIDTISAAAVVAALSLALAAFSFYWTQAHRGRLKSYRPYAFLATVHRDDARFLLPLAIRNTGAAPIAVQNLRLRLDDSPEHIMWWSLTREHLDDNERRYPSTFVAKGREMTQVVAEFATRQIAFSMPMTDRTVTVEVLMGHDPDWKTLVTFDLYLSRIDMPHQYIGYSNDPHFEDYHPLKS